MNRYYTMAAVFGVLGLGFLGYSITTGEGSAGVVVIFPVFFGSGPFAFLGVLSILMAIFLAFVGFAHQNGERFEDSDEPASRKPTESGRDSSIKGGGVVLIGPVPIIFGSDTRLTIVLVILAIVLMVSVAILFYFV
jgi:uncharacterized protein (TIGR00304 family)